MLTRELLSTGAYLDSFKDLPGLPRWTQQRIEASMCEALKQRDTTQPVWLFAYGSLIWNPLFKYELMQPALLTGWQRSFCLRLLDGRAKLDEPGRMLALDVGAETAGMAFKMNEENLLDELWLVWVREMVHGLYRPVWVSAQLQDGSTVCMLTFVADTDHFLYETDNSVSVTAKIIAKANGHLGSNRDYLMQLEKSLNAHQIHDKYISELAAAVREYSPTYI